MSSDLFKGRPALFGFVCFGGGIAAERIYIARAATYSMARVAAGTEATAAFLIGALFLLCIGLSLLILLRQFHFARLLTLGLCLVSLAAMYAATLDLGRDRSTIARLASLKPADARVTGRISDLSEMQKGGRSLMIDCDSLTIEPCTVAVEGIIEVTVPNDSLLNKTALEPGARLSVVGQLEPLTEPGNPYEYAAELRLRDVHGARAKLHIYSPFDLRLAAVQGRQTPQEAYSSATASIRSRCLAALDSAIGDTAARAFIAAVVVGERKDLPEDTKNDFTSSGVSHILAVSGFNVAIIALLLSQLLRLFGVYQRTQRTLLAMLGVAGYCAVVGFEPSVVRALLMVESYFAATLLERMPDPINIVAGAALITLLVQPFDLFDAGFQLSYGAVFGMAIIYPEIKRLMGLDDDEAIVPGRARRTLEAMALSMAATVSTLPVIVWQFHRFSIVGTLANLPVIPLAGLLTILGFMLVPIAMLSPWLGRLYGEGTVWMTKALFLLTHAAGNMPRATIPVAQPSWIYLLLFVGGLYYIVQADSRRRVVARIILSVLLAVVVGLFIPFRNPVVPPTGELSVLAFDVGQGDCMLITTPTGKRFMMDFGGVNLSNISQAERAVYPFMQAEGVTRIDGGFITHMHRDHYGGAPFLIEHLGLGHLYWTGERVKDAWAHELDLDVITNAVPSERVSLGMKVQLDSETVLYILHPPKGLVDTRGPRLGSRLNNGSLVAKLVYRNTSMLFLGDIESLDEEMLSREYGSFLKSDVVKVAHHGSAGSVAKEFIRLVAPRFALISVGDKNRYGHPTALALQRWSKVGAQILRTDRNGAVLLVSDGRRFDLRDWRE